MDVPKQLGPKMQACSEQERRFVWEFVLNGLKDATDAARKAGYSDPGPHSSAIRVRAHEVRHRPRVREAMQEVARAHFGGMLLQAVLAAEALVQNEKHPDHAKMVLAVLSAHGLGERSTLDVNVAGEVNLNHTDAALENLRFMRSLGVSREKMEEFFGHSGLPRYERMLAEQEARAPKLIEGKAEEMREP